MSLILLAAAFLAANTPPADARAFADAMRIELAAALPDARFAAAAGDPLELEMITPEAERHIINLHRVYGFCQSAPADACREQKERFAKALATTLRPPPITAEQLRVIVRDADYKAYVDGQLGEKGSLVRSIGDGLHAFLVVDSPAAIQLLARADLNKLNLDEESVWARATTQTMAKLPDPPGKLDGDVLRYEGDEYMASLFLDPRWPSLAARIGPDLVAVAASDQMVMFARARAGRELENIRTLAIAACRQAARCVSPQAWRWRDGRWTPVRP